MPVTSLSPIPEEQQCCIMLAHEVHVQARDMCMRLMGAYDSSPLVHIEAKRWVERIDFAVDRCIEHEVTALLLGTASAHERLLTSAQLLQSRVHAAQAWLSRSEAQAAATQELLTVAQPLIPMQAQRHVPRACVSVRQ